MILNGVKKTVKEKRKQFFMDKDFSGLIKTIEPSIIWKIKNYTAESKRSLLNRTNNFFIDFKEKLFVSLYNKKMGFSIPEEQVVENYIEYITALSLFLQEKYSIHPMLTHTQMITGDLFKALTPSNRTMLERRMLSIVKMFYQLEDKGNFPNNIKLLSIYLEHKKNNNIDEPFYNKAIDNIATTAPLTVNSVRIKNELFKIIANKTPDFAKQYIKQIDEIIEFAKDFDIKTLPDKEFFYKDSYIKDAFTTLENILGEERLLTHMRLNMQNDVFYSTISETHPGEIDHMNERFLYLIWTLHKEQEPNLQPLREYRENFMKQPTNHFHESLAETEELFKENSFFNEKMNMPLTKLKKYFLLLKKTGELEHIKNEHLTCFIRPNVYAYNNASNYKSMLNLFEKVAFLEQFNIKATIGSVVSTHYNSSNFTPKIEHIYLKDYLTTFVNYLTENKIKSDFSPELFDTLKEREAIEFSKKLSKIDKKIKDLMINSSNLFKRKLF